MLDTPNLGDDDGNDDQNDDKANEDLIISQHTTSELLYLGYLLAAKQSAWPDEEDRQKHQ